VIIREKVWENVLKNTKTDTDGKIGKIGEFSIMRDKARLGVTMRDKT
jgi:hypothetical protein